MGALDSGTQERDDLTPSRFQVPGRRIRRKSHSAGSPVTDGQYAQPQALTGFGKVAHPSVGDPDGHRVSFWGACATFHDSGSYDERSRSEPVTALESTNGPRRRTGRRWGGVVAALPHSLPHPDGRCCAVAPPRLWPRYIPDRHRRSHRRRIRSGSGRRLVRQYVSLSQVSRPTPAWTSRRRANRSLQRYAPSTPPTGCAKAASATTRPTPVSAAQSRKALLNPWTVLLMPSSRTNFESGAL